MAQGTTSMIHQRKQVRAKDALKGEILAPTNQGWIPFTTIWIIHTSMFLKSFHVPFCLFQTTNLGTLVRAIPNLLLAR